MNKITLYRRQTSGKLYSLTAWVRRYIPGYAIMPLLLMMTVNGISYFGTKVFTDKMVHYDMSTEFDLMIPFLPVFVIPYVLAFLQWGIGYIMIAWEGRDFAYRIYSAEILAKIACCITFVLLPTTIVRPLITSNDLFSQCTSFIYSMDSPVNLFPSIHCLESWFCLRGILLMKTVKKPVKIMNAVFTVLVFMSTVCLKQHFLVDIAGAVLYGEISLLVISFFFGRSYC